MKITCLVENTTSNENLNCEHGLCFYIETSKHKILCDLGQSDLFYENAKKLKIDLGKIDIVFLSHGHYDHGGGLAKFIEINSSAKIYASKYVFDKYFNGEKYIGLDESLKISKNIMFCNDEFQIDNQLKISNFKTDKISAKQNKNLMKISNGKKVADDFMHEQYFEIEDSDTKLLYIGCAHKGILNILQNYSKENINYYLGGFHFKGFDTVGEDKIYLEKTAEKLKTFETNFLTCHCTGVEQFKIMKEKNNQNLKYFSTGDILEI